MGLCKSTDCSVYFWFPRFVVLYVPCILCFLDFEKCKISIVRFDVENNQRTLHVLHVKKKNIAGTVFMYTIHKYNVYHVSAVAVYFNI